jgi:hypothetical protein
MVEAHPAATHHLPSFITAPGDTDVLMVIMSFVLVFAVMGFGILFLRLHSLPEQIAHRSHKLQFELVAVLGLISLFTHMHIFWIVGLLLAMIDLPDFGTPLGRIAGSVEKMAGLGPGEGLVEIPDKPAAAAKSAEQTAEAHGAGTVKQGDAVVPLPKKVEVAPANTAEVAPAGKKESAHA